MGNDEWTSDTFRVLGFIPSPCTQAEDWWGSSATLRDSRIHSAAHLIFHQFPKQPFVGWGYRPTDSTGDNIIGPTVTLLASVFFNGLDLWWMCHPPLATAAPVLLISPFAHKPPK